MNRNLTLTVFLLSFLLGGCATKMYVDAKGRDCKSHWVYPLFMWDECDKTQEPLATIRTEQKISVDANINATK